MKKRIIAIMMVMAMLLSVVMVQNEAGAKKY
jgi:hypothetical protein